MCLIRSLSYKAQTESFPAVADSPVVADNPAAVDSPVAEVPLGIPGWDKAGTRCWPPAAGAAGTGPFPEESRAGERPIRCLRHKVARWQNLIPSFPWIAPGRRAWERNPRKGRDQILQRSVAEP